MPTVNPSAPVNSGDVLASKYRVERILGVGGMGVVVSAVHIELDQVVALKFLHPDAATNPEMIERFVREARASVRLKSPHVAKTLDVGRLDDGRPYIVMELLEGRDLDAELRSVPMLSFEDAASYVLQACDALAEAHALGIVHRDLKPSNLFVTIGPDGRPQIKVFDFGISKFLDEPFVQGRTPSSLTKTESVFGSPAYMSPEQMRSSRDVDERTDLWALGIILYELLTKRIPFEAQSAIEMGLKVVSDAPLPPRAFRADVPEGLEQVVLRCLQKNPNNRFSDVGELAMALAPFAHPRDQTIAARAVDIVSTRQRSGKHPTSLRAFPVPSPSPSNRAISAWGTTHISTPTTNKRPRSFWLTALVGVTVLAAVAVTIAVIVVSRNNESGGTRATASASSGLPEEPSDASLAAAPRDAGVIELDPENRPARATAAASTNPKVVRTVSRPAANTTVPRAHEDHATAAADGGFYRVRE